MAKTFLDKSQNDLTYQKITDSTLNTTNKTIVGAINEVNNKQITLNVNDIFQFLEEDEFYLTEGNTKIGNGPWGYNTPLNNIVTKDTNYPTLNTNNKSLIGSVNEVNTNTENNSIEIGVLSTQVGNIIGFDSQTSHDHWTSVGTALKIAPNGGIAQTNTNLTPVNPEDYIVKQYVDNKVSSITKTSIGLGNVDNTSDANKPVSSASLTALNLKQNVTDSALNTTDKIVVGAINEVNTNKMNIDCSNMAVPFSGGSFKLVSTTTPSSGETALAAIDGTTGSATYKALMASNYEMVANNYLTLDPQYAVSKLMLMNNFSTTSQMNTALALKENTLLTPINNLGTSDLLTKQGNQLSLSPREIWTVKGSGNASGQIWTYTMISNKRYRVRWIQENTSTTTSYQEYIFQYSTTNGNQGLATWITSLQVLLGLTALGIQQLKAVVNGLTITVQPGSNPSTVIGRIISLEESNL